METKSKAKEKYKLNQCKADNDEVKSKLTFEKKSIEDINEDAKHTSANKNGIVYSETLKMETKELKKKYFQLRLDVDMVSMTLFIIAVLTRMYRLDEPKNIV